MTTVDEFVEICAKLVGEMTINDIERLKEIGGAWADALGWISTHGNTTEAAVARTQRVAVGALLRARRPADVLNGQPQDR